MAEPQCKFSGVYFYDPPPLHGTVPCEILLRLKSASVEIPIQS